ncbi:TrkA family potassium uptake protein [Novosphingobium sp.]|uniref:potassium channel family protein n=1 Tax=Novosphingobium sp. TaxID=1874826 RepID=UPI0025EADF08|nr:potassium channel family protein [Novosphingobium sp.]
MSRQPRSARFRALRRRIPVPVWADVTLRLSAALALVAFVVLIHWLDRDGLRDTVDGHTSFLDVVYFTMISITTTGFGDIAPVSDRARMIEAVIVTPIRVAVLFIFVGTAYNFLFKRSWEAWRMKRIQQTLTGHLVVLGFGISGSQAVRELIERGTEPGRIVVMDPDPERLDEAEELGCNVLEGDASRDENLRAVHVDTAQSVLVSAGRDDSSILIVLTVRHLAPRVPISVVVRAEDNEVLAQQAGADTVINPVKFTGLLLAGSAQGTQTSDYLVDLASAKGRVQLVERPALPQEVGRSLDDLPDRARGLRLIRAGQQFGYWEPEAGQIEPGDQIIAIMPTA